jgi:3-mercaptopyruvate sulfurtransferase SseA
VARELMKLGTTNVAALEGGWQAWLDQQLPVQTGETATPGGVLAGRA